MPVTSRPNNETVAQLVEQETFNLQVVGSYPTGLTTLMNIETLLNQSDLTDIAYTGLPDHGWHFIVVVEDWLAYMRDTGGRIGLLAYRDGQFSSLDELRAAILWAPDTDPQVCQQWFRNSPWRETAAPWELAIEGSSYLEDHLCGRSGNWIP